MGVYFQPPERPKVNSGLERFDRRTPGQALLRRELRGMEAEFMEKAEWPNAFGNEQRR